MRTYARAHSTITTITTTNRVEVIIRINRAHSLIQHVNLTYNRIGTTQIATVSYREMVDFADTSSIHAFDVFECYEVFVVSIRAMYTLVMPFIIGGA